MGKIKISKTASEPTNLPDGSDFEELDFETPAKMIMPIEHYVNVSAKVENPEATASVEGVKSAPRKKSTDITTHKKPASASASASLDGEKSTSAKSASKQPLTLPEGSIGATVLKEKAKSAHASGSSAKTSEKSSKSNPADHSNHSAHSDHSAKVTTASTTKTTSTTDTANTSSPSNSASTAAATTTAAGAAAATAAAKKPVKSVDGMTKPKMRMVEVTEVETTAEEEFEAHRPREKKESDAPEIEEKSRVSKPRAALIGIGVALIVAALGGILIGLFTKKPVVPPCLVQFESNGGSKVESAEITCGETVARPADPTKEGFTFQDWIYGGSAFDFANTTIDEDITLVASWAVEEGVETVTIHFDSNGGSEVADIEVKKGSTAVAPVDPTRTSYKFIGWTLDGAAFDFANTTIDEDITLVAQWEAVASSNPSSNPGQTANKPKLESISVSDVTISVGNSKTVNVALSPSNAKYKIKITTSNANIAVCNAADGSSTNLKCEGKSDGKATITLTDEESGKSAKFTITVIVGADYISLDKTSITFILGEYETETIKATVTPESATNKQVTWTSSNPSIASVDANGKVTAHAKGTVTITATTSNGIPASCTVTVKEKPQPEPEPEPDPDPDTDPEKPEDD